MMRTLCIKLSDGKMMTHFRADQDWDNVDLQEIVDGLMAAHHKDKTVTGWALTDTALLHEHAPKLLNGVDDLHVTSVEDIPEGNTPFLPSGRTLADLKSGEKCVSCP